LTQFIVRGVRDLPQFPPVAVNPGNVIAFVSGKGGVGKTNLAVNITLQLGRAGAQPVLVDADFGLANADLLLPLPHRRSVIDLLDPNVPFAEIAAEGPCGARFVFGCCDAADGPERPRFGPMRCTRVLNRLRAESDAVLVDCGAGLGDEVTSFAMLADTVVVVTTPEPPALADAYATVKTLHVRGYRGRAGVAVNMADTPKAALSAMRRLQRTAQQFLGRELADFGAVPFDRHVSQAVAARRPVLLAHPHCAAAGAIVGVAGRLWERRGDLRSASLWQQVAALFL
jgi:flagellar biosynthesis protein FlhG